MSFSARQQGLYRPLVDRAWQAHCSRRAIHKGDKAARETWYREQLQTATGKASSRDLNPTRDFDRTMAHFERIAADDIDWQMSEGDGDARRLLYAVESAAGNHNLDAAYIARVAQQAYGTNDLSQLTEEQLHKLQQMLIIDCRRRNQRGDNPTTTYRRRPTKRGPSLNPARPQPEDDNIPF